MRRNLSLAVVTLFILAAFSSVVERGLLAIGTFCALLAFILIFFGIRLMWLMAIGLGLIALAGLAIVLKTAIAVAVFVIAVCALIFLLVAGPQARRRTRDGRQRSRS